MEALKRDPKFAQQKVDNVLYCPREEHLSLRPQFENTQVQYARPLGDHSRLPALTKTQSTFSDRSKRYTQEQSDFIVYLAHEMRLPYWYLIQEEFVRRFPSQAGRTIPALQAMYYRARPACAKHRRIGSTIL